MFPPNTVILVVDDMAGARGLVKSQLMSMGYKEVMEAENGSDAYTKLQASADLGMPVGLVISDWNMPVMDGLELLGQVRSNPALKNLPFLMVTAEGEMSQVLKAIQKGVSDYVVKPFDSDTLFRKIQAVFSKHARG